MARAAAGRNDGIILNGGNLNADQVAVGSRASARKTVYRTQGPAGEAWDDVRSRLAELARVLDQRAGELPEARQLAGRVEDIGAEIERPSPDRGKIAALLDTLASGTRNLGEIAASVVTLKTIVSGLLGLG